MTTITFNLDENNLYTGFVAFGHAGYNKSFGKDIVCSAISALTINFINSVDELTDCTVNVETNDETGFMNVSLADYESEDVQLLFKSLVLGLKGIEKDFSKYLKLTNRR